MVTSPPGSWPDHIEHDAKFLPPSIKPPHSTLEKERIRGRKPLPNKKHGEEAKRQKWQVELPPEILEQ